MYSIIYLVRAGVPHDILCVYCCIILSLKMHTLFGILSWPKFVERY